MYETETPNEPPMKKLLIVMLLLPLSNQAQQAPFEPSQTARYRVTFEADWSAATHPTDFPSNAHFSGLIGATHHRDTVIWRSGELASPGIEQMAETGGKTMLLDEITPLIGAGDAEHLLSGGGIGTSPGSVNLEFEISRDHPLVSLVSMIAPSPDWFVGVDSLSLRAGGQWLERLSVDLLPYDSGTDSGAGFQSPDSDTVPPEAIHPITVAPLDSGVPLGRFVFERLDTAGNLPLSGHQSGLYHDPERSGEGINVLIATLGERRFIFVTWFTYHDGNPLWLVGNIDFQNGDDQVQIPLFRTSGTGFGEFFNADDVELTPWGTISIAFPSCGHLAGSYQSDDTAFGSGTLMLEQLVGISGLACE